MDRDEDEQSSLGNDAELDREKNKVTGVKTTDQPPERKDLNDAEDRRNVIEPRANPAPVRVARRIQ